MKLPTNWRRNHTSELEYWLERHDNGVDLLSDEDCDEVLVELELRDRQAEAKGGLINGLAPER